jgi:hypothetical protein
MAEPEQEAAPEPELEPEAGPVAEAEAEPEPAQSGLADNKSMGDISQAFWATSAGSVSRGRQSHSNTILYISLVILYTKYTGNCVRNDFTVHA